MPEKSIYDDYPSLYFGRFCGEEPFWDYNLTWFADKPALTSCFYQITPVWIPCIFLWLVSSIYMPALFSRPKRMNPKLSLLTKFKLFFTFALIVYAVADLGLVIDHHVGTNSVPQAFFISPILSATTLALAMAMIIFEHLFGAKTSLPLFIFLGITSLVHILTFQHYIRVHAGIIPESPLAPGLEIRRGILFYLSYVFVVSAFVAQCFVEPSSDAVSAFAAAVAVQGHESPVKNASILSKMYFEWMSELVMTGNKRQLTRDDLWNLTEDQDTAAIAAAFNYHWSEELRSFEEKKKKSSQPAVSSNGVVSGGFDNEIEMSPIKKFENAAGSEDEETETTRLLKGGAPITTTTTTTKPSPPPMQKHLAPSSPSSSSSSSSSSFSSSSSSSFSSLSPSFFKTLLKTFGGSMLRNALLRAFVMFFELVTPIILGWLITHIADKPISTIDGTENNATLATRSGGGVVVAPPAGSRVMSYEEWLWKGISMALLLGIISYLKSAMLQAYFWFSTWDGIRFQTTTIQAVYIKSLRLSSAARQDSTVGEIVNLISVDASKFVSFIPYSNDLWVSPIQVGMALYLLWLELGPSCLVGVLLMILLIPINAYTGKKIRDLQLANMKLKDSRVKLMNEILNGMKVLKLYAWEPSFLEKVSSIRSEETHRLRTKLYWSAIITVLFSTAPVFVAIAAFTSYTLSSTDNILNAKTAFVSVSLFNVMRFPLNNMPQVAIMLFQILISVRRISDFLVKEEMEEDAITYEPPPREAIKVSGGAFTWGSGNDSGGTSFLHDVEVSIPKGSLVSIVGSVGCGKSSLLSAFLGEMHKDGGQVQMTHSVAYVSQAAWIQNVSLKDNILFGHPLLEEKYKQVIKACALEPDLEILPAGDLTEIGEKGINLSGGQKLRVALARAVYADADLYLLDDPLSAVDVHVGKHIFDNVIATSSTSLLRDKTRVLVTNALQYLPQSNLILAIKDGRIAEQGSYEALMAKVNGEFANFVHAFTDKLQKEEESDEGDEDEDGLEEVVEVDELDEVFAAEGSGGSGGGDGGVPFMAATATSEESAPAQRLTKKSRRTFSSISAGTMATTAMRRRKTSSVMAPMISTTSKLTTTTMKLPAAPLPKDGGKLIEEEKMATGGFAVSVFLHYLQAMGWAIPLTGICFILLARVAEVASNFWLSHWTEQMRQKMMPPPPAIGDVSAQAGAFLAAAMVNGLPTMTMPALTATSINDSTMMTTTARSSTAYAAEKEMPVASFYLGIYAVLGLLAGLFMMVASFFNANGVSNASRRLHRDLATRIMACPMSFFDTVPLGRILNRFSKDMDTVDSRLGEVLFFFYFVCIYMVFSFITIATVTPYFLIVFPVLGFFYIALQRVYIATSRQLKRLESISKSPIYSLFGETIQGAPTIRAFRRQKDFQLELNRRVDQNMKAWYAQIGSERWLGFRLEIIGSLVQVFSAIFAITTASLTPGDVGLSITYAINVTGMLSYFIKNLSDLENNLVAVERIKEYCEVPMEKPWRIDGAEPDEAWPTSGTGFFENYSVRYREGLDLVLKELNFSFKDGERIGIVGRTGAGKSSLTLALFRILEASSGTISLSEKNVANMGLHDLRSKISIIPQDPVVFSGTLRLNLDPFQHHTDAEIWDVLALAHLKDFVSTLDAWLDFLCAEYGDNLSMGQRQLVCLARALLRRSRILVLDEATAAIDLETDALVQKTIRENFCDATILTIAHRLNTVINYSRVVVLDKGKIVEFDSPGNLLKDPKTIFHSMAKDAGLI